MSRWLAVLFLLLGAVGVVIIFLIARPGPGNSKAPEITVQRPSAPEPASAIQRATNPPATVASNPGVAPVATIVPSSTAPVMTVPAAVSYTNVPPGIPPPMVLENMRSAIRNYGSRFGGNPVGNNAEITKALNGGNPGQVQFISEDSGLRISDKGELTDPWGTPFFFHQLSASEMEIRSAGPDRQMWTQDDLVTK